MIQNAFRARKTLCDVWKMEDVWGNPCYAAPIRTAHAMTYDVILAMGKGGNSRHARGSNHRHSCIVGLQ